LISGIVINTIIIWLLTKTNKSALAQKILIVIFIGIVFLLLNFYAELNKIRLLHILTFNIQDTITLFFGPLLYVYVKSLFIEDKKLIRKNRFHFIFPLLYLMVYSIPDLFYSYFEIKLTPFAENLYAINDYFFVINDFYLLIYLLLTLKLLSTYNKVARSIYSNLKDKELRWVKYFIVCGIFIIIVDIFTYVYDYFYTEQELNSGFVTVGFIVIMLFFLGYYGVKQSKILVPEFLLNPVINKEPSVNSIKMNPIEIEERISKIKEVLSKERLFLDEDLTLNKLANKVSLNDKKLSAIINQEMNTSFYDLINSYRLEEFKRRVSSDEFSNLTILGIAYDCGFKTKSTFNRLFKLNTGMAPSEYKKNENKFQ